MTVQQQRRFLSILIMLLSLTSTIAFSSVGGPALATKTSMKTTTTSLHAWGVPSVPTSVWAIEAHPTARRIEYYDDVPSFTYSTPGDDWTEMDLEDDDVTTTSDKSRWLRRAAEWARGNNQQ